MDGIEVGATMGEILPGKDTSEEKTISDEIAMDKNSKWQTIKTASKGLKQYVKTKVGRKKKDKQTKIEEIHIAQDDDETWARRSASSSRSRTSVDTYSSGEGNRELEAVEVIHDMDDDL